MNTAEVARWEVQAHFTVGEGRALSLSAAFVRIHTGGAPCHFVLASLSDVHENRCFTVSAGDQAGPGVLLDRFESEQAARNPLVVRALREVLERGRLPYPDTLTDQATIATGPLSCDVAGNRLTELEPNRYRLVLRFADDQRACELTFVARKPAVRGGNEDALSEWLPRLDVEGTMSVGDVSHPVTGGTGSYFRVCGGHKQDRVVVQLDDLTDIFAYRAADNGEGRAIVSRADGEHEQHDDITLDPVDTWSSLYTFHQYAVGWRLRIPRAHIDLELGASFANQELVTVAAGFPLWHGRCQVSGAAPGVAYVEHMAADATDSLPAFFASIPRETLNVIRKLLPVPVDFDDMANILGVDPQSHYVRDVNHEEFQEILLGPIREILDRKGKAWRSYAAVVCYYALRGDKWRQDIVDILLALSEVLHTGSLIVDDVEDESPTRRDGPACHVAHGEPIAINAGTFCYFVWQSWIARADVPDAARLRIYNLYFEFMRLAHLGQALDLQGVTPQLAEQVVASGDVGDLRKQMRNVYLLKTGAPASVVARFGAILAGGNDEQIDALGNLFEALGLAFQIMDDVHNLRGFVGDPKHCEDLVQAKLTMPVLHAMNTLDSPARRDLWQRIQRCGDEAQLIPGIVSTLKECGALTACRDEARVLLDTAWEQAEPALEDSFAKIMLRTFCWYVVQCLE